MKSNIRVVPFQPEHTDRIRLQPRQRGWAGSVTPDTLAFLATQPSITVLDGDEVLMCGGWFPLWPGRGAAWSLMAEGIGARMTGVVRAGRKVLDTFNGWRLELDVETDFDEGHRLARLLGFELESPCLSGYYPSGADAAMYVKKDCPTPDGRVH
jgi:hypothetical protein